MSKPISSDYSLKDQVLDGVQDYVPTIWNGAKGLAKYIQGAAEWTWGKLPDTRGYKVAAANAWKDTPHKTTIKKAVAVGAGVVVAGTVAMAAPVSLVAGGAALATGATVVYGSNALGAATGKTIAAGTAGLAVGATLPFLAPAAFAASVTFMAEHPDRSILLNVPERDPIELRTPGEGLDHPVDPKTSIKETSAKIVQFRQKQPAGMFSKTRERRSPVDPEKAALLQKEQANTKGQLDRLLDNTAAYTTAYFILVNRLGINTIQPNGEDILMEITQEATKRANGGSKPNLWQVCKKVLERRGLPLTLFQRVRARFWYFFAHTIGVIPNTFKEIGEKLLGDFRTGVGEGKSKPQILRLLAIVSSFLDRYKGAMKSYTDAGNPGMEPLQGDLATYQKKIISELGDDDLLTKVRVQLKPGENLGKKMMHELCKEFVATIADDPEIFPSIPFFRNLQNFTLLGIRFGAVFDVMEWIFGGLISWGGKKLIKSYAPDAIQAIVQNGIDQALPGKYSFKIAIANALTTQLEDLKVSFQDDTPSAPIRFEENSQLNETIKKLTQAIKLNSPTSQEELRKKMAELECPSKEDEALDERLNQVIIQGTQLLIDYFTKKPEALEKLFGNVFSLCCEPFQAGAALQTESDYLNALGRFKSTVHDLVKGEVKRSAQILVRGEDPNHIRTVLEGKRKRDLKLDYDSKGAPLYPLPLNQKGEPLYRYRNVLDKQGKPLCRLVLDEQERPTFRLELDEKGDPIYPAERDQAGNPVIRLEKDPQENPLFPYELDAQGNPLYIGIISEQKQKALDCLLTMRGHLREMTEKLQTSTPVNGPLLKDLDSYVESIYALIEHGKSLNVDLYPPMVQKAFNRIFSPVYGGVQALMNPVIDLQALLKSYDKSKRLLQHFNAVRALRGDEPNLQELMETEWKKIEAVDQDFNQYEADRGNNVIAFEALRYQFKELSTEFLQIQQNLQNLQNLGSAHQLSSALIAHPKKTLEKIREGIPSGDQEPLFSAIAQLQENALKKPKVNLAPDQTRVEIYFQAIAEKYAQLLEEKGRERGQKFDQIKNWARARAEPLLQKQTKTEALLTEKLTALETATSQLVEKIDAAKLPVMHFPIHAAGPLISKKVDHFVQGQVDLIVNQIMSLVDDGYIFATSEQLTEAGARLLLGEFIRTHKK